MSISPSRTPDEITLNTISSIGRFNPMPFVPHIEKKVSAKTQEYEIVSNVEGLRTLQAKAEKLQKSVSSLDQDISFLQSMIDRQKTYMDQIKEDHQQSVNLLKQQLENRKIQLSKIDTSQDPPTSNQIAALIRQIQVEGMAAKRRAENSLHDQDINIVLSGERLKRFHDVLVPKISDQVLTDNPKLKKCYERLETAVYRSAEVQTQLRSIRIFSSNLERKLVEMNSKLEALQFDKADIQMGIVDKKEELHAEMTKKCEELGKLRWKIEYMKALKKKMSEPHFDVRKLDA